MRERDFQKVLTRILKSPSISESIRLLVSNPSETIFKLRKQGMILNTAAVVQDAFDKQYEQKKKDGIKNIRKRVITSKQLEAVKDIGARAFEDIKAALYPRDVTDHRYGVVPRIGNSANIIDILVVPPLKEKGKRDVHNWIRKTIKPARDKYTKALNRRFKVAIKSSSSVDLGHSRGSAVKGRTLQYLSENAEALLTAVPGISTDQLTDFVIKLKSISNPQDKKIINTVTLQAAFLNRGKYSDREAKSYDIKAQQILREMQKEGLDKILLEPVKREVLAKARYDLQLQLKNTFKDASISLDSIEVGKKQVAELKKSANAKTNLEDLNRRINIKQQYVDKTRSDTILTLKKILMDINVQLPSVVASNMPDAVKVRGKYKVPQPPGFHYREGYFARSVETVDASLIDDNTINIDYTYDTTRYKRHERTRNPNKVIVQSIRQLLASKIKDKNTRIKFTRKLDTEV